LDVKHGGRPARRSFASVALTGELNLDGDEGLFEGSGGPIATRYLASTSKFAGSISRSSRRSHPRDRAPVVATECA
jgi:hypothetical protein